MTRLPIRYRDRPLRLEGRNEWLDGLLVHIGGASWVVQRRDLYVLAVTPDGSYRYDSPGIHAPQNRCLRDPTANVLRFFGTGMTYLVPYRLMVPRQ